MDKINHCLDTIKEHADQHKEITLGLAAIGGVYMIGHALCKLNSIYKYFIRPSLNLKARYGNGWAVVTGASDGIGKAYAFELAKRGFKVGLVARNQEKLDKVAEEIKKDHNVETKVVVFDFDGDYTDEKINELKDKLEVFENVSILINNVGVGIVDNFNDLEIRKIKSLVNVNAVGLTILIKLLLPKLLANKSKGGIINIGSGGTMFIYPGFNVYSSTKWYVTMLSKSIAAEYGDKIDWMIATVGPTKTNMNPGVAALSSYPESIAHHTLNSLGREVHTFGDWRHGLRMYLLARKLEGSIVRWIDRKNVAIMKAHLEKINP